MSLVFHLAFQRLDVCCTIAISVRLGCVRITESPAGSDWLPVAALSAVVSDEFVPVGHTGEVVVRILRLSVAGCFSHWESGNGELREVVETEFVRNKDLPFAATAGLRVKTFAKVFRTLLNTRWGCGEAC
jgi:hypothetical protein